MVVNSSTKRTLISLKPPNPLPKPRLPNPLLITPASKSGARPTINDTAYVAQIAFPATIVWRKDMNIRSLRVFQGLYPASGPLSREDRMIRCMYTSPDFGTITRADGSSEFTLKAREGVGGT